MAGIEGGLVINRPVAEVFDFAADERNEPATTHESGGPGSSRPAPSAAGHASRPSPGAGRLDDHRVPDLGAPRRLASFIDMAAGDIVGTLRFDRSGGHPDGLVMRAAAARAVQAPDSDHGWRGRRQERATWAGVKRCPKDKQGRRPSATLAGSGDGVGPVGNREALLANLTRCMGGGWEVLGLLHGAQHP